MKINIGSQVNWLLFKKNVAYLLSLLCLSLFITSCQARSDATRINPPTIIPNTFVNPTENPSQALSITPPNPTASQTPTQDLHSYPQSAKLLETHEFAVQIDYYSPSGESGTPMLVLIGEEDYGPVGMVIPVNIIDWNGKLQKIASITYTGREGLTKAAITALPINTESPWLVFAFGEISMLSELYGLELSSGSVWGINPSCSSSMERVVGDQYVAYRCIEDPFNWNFILLADPSIIFSLSLSDSTTEPFDSEAPLIRDGLALFYPFLSDQVCSGLINEWQPHCKDIPFWLGPMSPDGSLFEVRTGLDFVPDNVGIIDSDCILKQKVSCDPILIAPPPDFAPRSSASRSLGDSVWLPNNEGLLYMVHIDTDHTNQSPEESELWMYRLADQSFHRLSELPGVQYFGDPWFGVEEPGYWSPDGGSIVISDWDTFSLLNISTGDLTPLTEGGVLLGTITLP